MVATVHGPRTFKREIGQPLHPTRQPLEVLNELKSSMTDYDFAGQYQQAPVPLGGGMIKYDWFVRFDLLDPPAFGQIIQSWDTASTPGTLGDFSVCTTWGIAQNKHHLLSVFRERVGYPELKQAVIDQARRFRPDVILIENKSSGIALIQDLVAGGVPNVQAYQPRGDKVMRMYAQTATIKNGFVFVPAEAPWLGDYLHEMTSFNFGRYDDQVDSTSQFLDWAKVIEPGLLTFMRQQAQALTQPSAFAPMKKLKRPANSAVTTIYLIDGKQINVPAEGIVEVGVEDAGPLIQQGWTPAE